MKRSFLAALLSCAFALGLSVAQAVTNDWFKGVTGTITTKAELQANAVNGTWDIPSTVEEESLTFADNAIVISDVETNLTFSVTDGTAPDTQTVTCVSFSLANVTVCSADDFEELGSGATDPSFALAFAYASEASDPTNLYVGSGSTWVAVTNNALLDATTADSFLAAIDYKQAALSSGASTKVLLFAVKGSQVYPLYTDESTSAQAVTLATTPTKLASIGITGTAKVSKIDGKVAMAVATFDGIRYDLYKEAMAADSSTAGLGFEGVTSDPNQLYYYEAQKLYVRDEWLAQNKQYPDYATKLAANGANGIANWQNSILGLDPNDSAAKLRMVAKRAGDTSADVIQLEAQSTIATGSGYTVTYQRKKWNSSTSAWEDDGTAMASPQIPISGASGNRFRINVVLTPDEGE